MKEILTKLLNLVGWAYWVKITTASPNCTYFFGPFLSLQEAKSNQPGFIEDLKGENAKDIRVEIKRCQPQELTIFDESTDKENFKFVPAIDGQSI